MVKRRRWTQEELDFLRDHYTEMTAAEIGKVLGRSKDAIHLQRRAIGLDAKRQQRAPWSEDEIEFLKSNYLELDYGQLAAMMGRSKAAIRGMRYILGLELKAPFWSEDDIAKLHKHYTGEYVMLPELAETLHRDRSNIARKARAEGLPARKPTPLPENHEQRSEAAKRQIRQNGHPRGFLGYHHTSEAKRKIAAKSSLIWKDPNHIVNSPEYRQAMSDRMAGWRKMTPSTNAYSRSKYGRRADLDNRFFRSAWEANYARYLNWLARINIVSYWQYEPKTFWFEGIKRGCRSYTPDFLVKFADGTEEWHEVKGWMDDKSKTKIKRFGIYYPNEKLVVIDADCYMAIHRQCKNLVPGWE